MALHPTLPGRSRLLLVLLVALLAGLAGLAVVRALRPAPPRWIAATPAPAPEKLRYPAIPTPPGATLERVDDALLEAWARRNLLEAYERTGRHGPWDAVAREYVTGELPVVMGRRAGSPAPARLELGRRALAQGCRDPLVEFLVGRHLWAERLDPGESIALLRRAVAGFRQIRYPRGAARLAASTLREAWESARSEADWGREAEALELAWFREALVDGSYAEGESVVLVWQATRGDGDCFKRHGEKLVAALQRAPRVEEWARLYFSARGHRDRAWQARGEDFADRVPESAWPLFRAESALAHQDLVRSWTLRPDRPEAAALLIVVSRDAQAEGETARLWFERAVSARFDYRPAYDQLFGSLYPQWGGSAEEMMGLGLAAADTRRYDTKVPGFLLSALEQTMSDQLLRKRRAGPLSPRPVYAFEMPGVKAAVRQVLEGYLAAPDPPEDRAVYHSVAAIMAERSARFGEARQHLAQAGFRLRRDVLWRIRGQADLVETRAVALGGPAAGTIGRAEQARAAGGLAAALPLFEQALHEDPEPAAQKWVLDRMALLQWEERLAAGGWADLQPRRALLEGWQAREGQATLEDDGALRVSSGWRGTLVDAGVRLGPDFELAARIELVASTNGAWQAGLVFGDASAAADEWAVVRLHRHSGGQERVELLRNHDPHTPLRSVPVRLRPVNDLGLLCRARRVTITLNGTVVLREADLEPDLPLSPSTTFWLGADIDDNSTVVRYRDVRARRLEARAGG